MSGFEVDNWLPFAWLVLAAWFVFGVKRNADAPPPPPAPDKVLTRIDQMIRQVQFDKRMVGDGCHVTHSCRVKTPGQPDVHVLVTTAPISAKDFDA